MNSQLLPHVQVRFSGVTWHRWTAGHIADLPTVNAATEQVIDGALWITLQPGVVVGELNRDGTIRRRWQLAAGTAFLWPMSSPRRIMTPNGGEWLSVRLRATLFDRINLFDWLDLPREIPLRSTQKKQLKQNVTQLLRLCHGDSPPSVDYGSMYLHAARMIENYAIQTPMERWITQSLTQAIFGVCWTACRPETIPNAPQHEIPLWLSSALERFDRESFLKVNEVAHTVGFSVAQFRRLFEQWTGMPPQQYLHQRRMERARALLETSDLPIGEIAHTVGFSSVSHFTSVFKSAYNLTPTRYRQTFTSSIA